MKELFCALLELHLGQLFWKEGVPLEQQLESGQVWEPASVQMSAKKWAWESVLLSARVLAPPSEGPSEHV